MTRRLLLPWIKQNAVNRFIAGFLAIFITLTVLILFFLYPIRIMYYGLASGNYLLGFQSAIAEKTVEQDDKLSVAFCRNPRVRVVAVDNVRTFYLTKDGQPVFERHLPDGITYEAVEGGCLPLTIKSDQRPNTLGTYRFCQEFDFYTEFKQKKTAHFCTTEYMVTAPKRDVVPQNTLVPTN